MASDDPRQETRIRAVINGVLRDSASDREVRILDVSTRGILAACDDPPRRGEFVEVTVGRNSLVGQVKWSGGKRFGMVLRQRVSPSALISGEGGPVDLARSVAARRRSGGLLDSLRGNSRSMGQAAQFAIALVALGGAAWLAADYAGQGLSSLGDARQAMSAGNFKR